jgi:hypothetical protein
VSKGKPSRRGLINVALTRADEARLRQCRPKW